MQAKAYKAGQWREWIFSIALASIALSAVVLLGSFLRHMQATDYFKQFEEALPWIRWGTGSALLGLMLSFFGRRYLRIAAAVIALLMFVFWLLIGAASL